MAWVDLWILYDQDISLHFPAHYDTVYRRMLPLHSVSTAVWAPNSARKCGDRGLITFPISPGRAPVARLQMAWRMLAAIPHWSGTGRGRFVLVHDDPVMACAARIVSMVTGAGFIYRISHLKPETQALSGGWRRWLARALMAARDGLIVRADAVVCMSDEMRRYFQRRLVLPKRGSGSMPARWRDWAVVPSMVDALAVPEASGDHPHRHAIADWRRSAGIGCVLVYAGTLNPGRELTFLLDCLRAARERIPGAGLVVLGVSRRSEFVARLAAAADRLGVRPQVLFLPPVEPIAVAQVLAGCDIGLAPYPTAGIFRCNSPVKTLEYLLAGLPVVGSDIPDQRLVLAASGGGLAVTHEPAAFARAIAEIAAWSDDQRNDRMIAARRWVTANRHLTLAADILARVVRLAVARRREAC